MSTEADGTAKDTKRRKIYINKITGRLTLNPDENSLLYGELLGGTHDMGSVVMDVADAFDQDSTAEDAKSAEDAEDIWTDDVIDAAIVACHDNNRELKRQLEFFKKWGNGDKEFYSDLGKLTAFVIETFASELEGKIRSVGPLAFRWLVAAFVCGMLLMFLLGMIFRN